MTFLCAFTAEFELLEAYDYGAISYEDAYRHCFKIGKYFEFIGEVKMSEIKHTPEPWAVEISHNGGCVKIVETGLEYPRSLGQLVSYGDRQDINAKANARRIVAAVNACAGLSTDELEKTEVQKIAQQRDQLLEALKGLERSYGYIDFSSDEERNSDPDLSFALETIAAVEKSK